MACVKSVLWPALVSTVVDVSLPGGSLGYWTACNKVKDPGNSSSRSFVSEFRLFHNFVIVNDIDFKFSAVADNNITFDLQQ